MRTDGFGVLTEDEGEDGFGVLTEDEDGVGSSALSGGSFWRGTTCTDAQIVRYGA